MGEIRKTYDFPLSSGRKTEGNDASVGAMLLMSGREKAMMDSS